MITSWVAKRVNKITLFKIQFQIMAIFYPAYTLAFEPRQIFFALARNSFQLSFAKKIRVHTFAARFEKHPGQWTLLFRTLYPFKG
jgi:hypothetical protein